MNSPLLLVAALFIHPGQEDAFRDFETQAAQIMARYGGRIERVIRPTSSTTSDAALPHEIHLVSFPTPDHFTAYRADPDLTALALLRQQAIARTEVVLGEEGVGY